MANLTIANKLFRKHDFVGAIEEYENLIAGNKGFYVYHENLGLARKEMHQYAESLKDFSSALKLDAEAVRSYYELAKYRPMVDRDHQPMLSIIVPVYNTQKYLNQCLSSILNQAFQDFELIVINDGSTDSSLKIIKEFQSKDDRIVLIDNKLPSGNPGTPRNQGIEIAKGRYLGFVDSDDWVAPDFFETLVKTAQINYADIVFSGGFTNVHDREVNVRRYVKTSFNDKNSGLYKYHESFMIWDKIYNASLIKNLNIRLGETKAAVDVPFIFKSYYYLRNAAFCDNLVGYNYRRESDSSVTVKYRKSSNCNFELVAYELVNDWADKYVTSSHYKNIIEFRKVNSYLYTLSVIAPNLFDGFFDKVKEQFHTIDRKIIANLANQTNKMHVLKKFDAVLGEEGKNHKLFLNKAPAKRTAESVADPGLQKKLSSFSFYIEGPRKGILFFPDWSHANPYQKLLYASLSERFKIKIKGYKYQLFNKEILEACKDEFDVIHIHWLHTFMDISKDSGADHFLDTLAFAKQLGFRVVYTAHNIISHDSEHYERELLFRKKAQAFFDYVLVHGEYAKMRIVDEIGVYPGKVYVVPHGSYEGFYSNYVTRRAAREGFDINDSEFVFLFFGNIKGYKGIDELLKSYAIVRSSFPHVRLIIAGRIFDSDNEALVKEACDKDMTIIYNPGFVEENDVQKYFNASDITILPYKRILTSGAAILSFSFHTPVIAPNSGLLPEIIHDGKQGYLYNSYQKMTQLMTHCASSFTNAEWGKINLGFDFSELNRNLKWGKIAALSPFNELFNSDESLGEIVNKHKKYNYAIIRILGNDLPFRHDPDQTLRNLSFTLENETNFKNACKLWILNHIIDKDKKAKLIALLKKHQQHFIDIPYHASKLVKIPFCFDDLPIENYKLTTEYDSLDARSKVIADTAILKHKNNYIMNNNGARNRALIEGKKIAEWVFPWDGNCFITDDSWLSITSMLESRPDLKYHIVPMDRVLDNNVLLSENYQPNPKEEPQIIFRHDASLFFDESLMYGLKPKVDLLKRLGVPGIWDDWKNLYPWKRHQIVYKPGAFAYSWAGWVARLFSGNQGQEVSALDRAINREKGIVSFISDQDRKALFNGFNKDSLCFYCEDILILLRGDVENDEVNIFSRSLKQLKNNVGDYLNNPLYTVTNKTTLPPSGNSKDYWHPAPYSWPNPNTIDGLPYIYKDGERVPGTRMYEPDSVKYDRTSIQRLFDETTSLALYGYIFQNDAYIDKAYRLIKTWFLADETSMNPHLTYSQVVLGKNDNKGTPSGLIETKDFYYFLDALRIVKRSAYWSIVDDKKMDNWCRQFLNWLKESDQGKAECRASNNHGVAYDLQTYALSAFLGDTDEMYDIIIRALSRLKSHVEEDGTQHHEMKRTTTAHYTAFNLHLWLNLHQMLKRTSKIDLVNYEHFYNKTKKSPIKLAASWVLSYSNMNWPFKQIDEFDKERYEHIYHCIAPFSPSIRKKYKSDIPSLENSKAVFFPHDGIAPYWLFGIQRTDLK